MGVISPDLKLSVTIIGDTVRLYNQGGVLLRTLSTGIGNISDVLFTPDSGKVVILGRDGSVKVMEVITGRITSFKLLQPPDSVRLSGDGQNLVFSYGELEAIYDLDGNKLYPK